MTIGTTETQHTLDVNNLPLINNEHLLHDTGFLTSIAPWVYELLQLNLLNNWLNKDLCILAIHPSL